MQNTTESTSSACSGMMTASLGLTLQPGEEDTLYVGLFQLNKPITASFL